MDRAELHDLLARLHRELEQGPPIDDADRALLGQVLNDVKQALEAPPAEGALAPAVRTEHQGIGERLREASWHLEESHPKLTTAVGNLVDALRGVFG